MLHFDTLKIYNCGKHCMKGEIACYKQVLLFSLCFLHYIALIFHFKYTLKMSSVICSNLDQSKMLSFGNGLMFSLLLNVFSLLLNASANTITAGQLLCGGLFSSDSLSNWFASVALLNAIIENPTQKEQLLRVQLATSVGNPPVSLLQQCCNILAQVNIEDAIISFFSSTG